MRAVVKGWMILLVWWMGILSLKAQDLPGMGWEEASMQAAREKKLVFVSVGRLPEKEVFLNPAVKNFFERYIVAIRMNMQSEAGRNFEPRLLMHPYPTYAFLMPFGDLLLTVDPSEAARKPQLLIEAGKEALKLAEIKRNNSRSVQFLKMDWEAALRQAKAQDKPVFLYLEKENCRECLLMEKNVFNLDRVADFYRKNFISLRISGEQQKKVSEEYGVKEYPAYFFVNGEGKLIYRTSGLFTEKEFLQEGEKVLKKARGICFESGSWQEVLDTARARGKGIFVDTYTWVGGERKSKAQTVYRDPEVAAFFNAHFVNVLSDRAREKENISGKSLPYSLPEALCFLDSAGRLMHVVAGVPEAEELLDAARRAVKGQGIMAFMQEYNQGNREVAFVEEYIRLLGEAGWTKQADTVTDRYLVGLPREQLKEKRIWELFRLYLTDVNSEVFKWVYDHRPEFYALYGEPAVNRKLEEVWLAGAYRFAVESGDRYVFDQTGFKEYVKRLKKEKVVHRNLLVRKARMYIAEKTGDWRTFAELAEERWKEEQIPEAELFGWGEKINANCTDKSIRYKAARWFAMAALELERKERINGSLSPSSYKGFFEKLVDDLIK